MEYVYFIWGSSSNITIQKREIHDVKIKTITLSRISDEILSAEIHKSKPSKDRTVSLTHLGMDGWGKGVVCLASPGRPTDIGLQMGKASILAAGKGIGGMFLFPLFLHFHSFTSFSPVPLFHLLYYLFYLSSPFLWDTTQNDPQELTCQKKKKKKKEKKKDPPQNVVTFVIRSKLLLKNFRMDYLSFTTLFSRRQIVHIYFFFYFS